MINNKIHMSSNRVDKTWTLTLVAWMTILCFVLLGKCTRILVTFPKPQLMKPPYSYSYSYIRSNLIIVIVIVI